MCQGVSLGAVSLRSVYRTDISTLRPVERRADGTIRVDAFLSKCGVFQYMQPDGTIRRELRLPEDVHDPESLRSFEGVPVTNNHPPGMIDASNAKQYSVGALLGVPSPDSDHIRGRLAVHDAGTVEAMENGKVQVSNGYSCDCLETPGVHPLYGAYDAVQKNIRGNHVAIVDRARAGVTAAARMDADCANGMMVLAPGTEVAFDTASGSCKSRAMASAPNARVEIVVRNDMGEPSATAKVDPNDLASRNASGATAAKKAAKEQPGAYEDDGGDRAKPRKGKPFPPDDDEEDDEDEDREDADPDDSDEGDEDAPDSDDKVAASTYALPGKKQLPIHSPDAVKSSMKKFGSHPFDDAGEKHGAFNRIASKGKQFGMDTARFEKKHAGNLDRADGANKDNAMSTPDIKALEEKAAKRKEKLVAARARIDSLETELAERDATIENMRRDAEAAKVAAPRADAEDVKKFEERVDSKIELLDKARQTGATVDSKMSDVAIKRAVVKHVDGKDVAEGKPEAYVDALFEGALERAKKDASETTQGADAIAAARAAVETTRANTHLDANTDEEVAKAALRTANRDMINQPSAARRAVR